MTHSGFDFNGLPPDAKATGYQFLDPQRQKAYTYLDSTVGYAAGAIYSTTGDMHKWANAVAGKQLLSAKSWKAAFTPRMADQGYGFTLGSLNNNRYIKHSGGYPGFAAEFLYYPDADVRIILLKNSGTYGQDLWPVVMGLSNIVFNQPYDLWKPRTEIKLDSTALAKVAGKYGERKSSFPFFIRENALYTTVNGLGDLGLLPESEETFYFENFNTQFTFRKNGNGVYDRLIVREHGKDIELKRLE